LRVNPVFVWLLAIMAMAILIVGLTAPAFIWWPIGITLAYLVYAVI
jgi:hypothetical protein